MQFWNIFMTFWWNEIIAMLGKLHELKYKRPNGLNRARFAEVKASAHRSALEIKVIAYILGTRTSIFFPNHESVMNHPNGFRNVFVKRSFLYLYPLPLPLSLSLSVSLYLALAISIFYFLCFQIRHKSMGKYRYLHALHSKTDTNIRHWIHKHELNKQINITTINHFTHR